MPLNVARRGSRHGLLEPRLAGAAGRSCRSESPRLPGVQSVSGVADPNGEGKLADLLRPSVQLPAAARSLRNAPRARTSTTSWATSPWTASNRWPPTLSGLAGGPPEGRRRRAGRSRVADLALIREWPGGGSRAGQRGRSARPVADQLLASAGSSAGASPAGCGGAAGPADLVPGELGAAVPELEATAAYQTAVAAIPKRRCHARRHGVPGADRGLPPDAGLVRGSSRAFYFMPAA